MSRLLYIVYNTPTKKIKEVDKEILGYIEKRIIPDNITPNQLKIIETKDSICSIFNPVSTIAIHDSSVCLGYSSCESWMGFDKRGEDIEGSFAILRNDEHQFQIVSDMVASRTLWYYLDDDVFLVSTSQRAIIAYLGSFEFNDEVIPWMLASGTLGPGYSYDKRLNMLQPNSVITLNKESWKLGIDIKDIKLKNNYENADHAKKDLSLALKSVFSQINIDNNNYVLPLSGGVDSRAILLFLENSKELKTITWGAKESREIKNNDAYVAKQLAEAYGVENIFLESYNKEISIEEVFDRFLICSEGRIDHIGGYLDGMRIWKNFFESGYETVLRGEELVGLNVVNTIFEARRDESLIILEDYFNISKEIIERLKPQKLINHPSDNLYEYKGLLALHYEHPIKFAALNDIKTAYTEIYSPLLSSSIIKTISNMFDDNIIGDKKIFEEIVTEKFPDIPYAKFGANKSLGGFLGSDDARKVFIKCFEEAIEQETLDTQLIKYTIDKIKPRMGDSIKTVNFTLLVKKILPQFIVEILKSKTDKREMDWNTFAFRLYIVIKMKTMFDEDSLIRNLVH